MKAFFKSIFGMFVGSDGIVSSTKLMSFIGYGLFIFVSIWTCVNNPEKFNYELFAILSASSSTTLRAIDKWLNVRSYNDAASAIVTTDVEVGTSE